MSSKTKKESICIEKDVIDSMECDICHISKTKDDISMGFDSSFMSTQWNAGYDSHEQDGKTFTLDVCYQCMARLGTEVK